MAGGRYRKRKDFTLFVFEKPGLDPSAPFWMQAIPGVFIDHHRILL